MAPGGTVSASGSAAKSAAVGQALNITGDGGLVATVTLASVTPHATGTGDIAQAPKKGMYVVANVKIAVTSGTYNFNPLYFKDISSDDNAYTVLDGNGTSAGYDPALDSGALTAGSRTGGNLTFDVPSAHGTLQLTDPLGSVIGSWTF